jgi:hypothetical protein
MHRRRFLKMVAGSAAVALGSGLFLRRGWASQDRDAASGELCGLGAGHSLADGRWTIAGVHAEICGGIPVLLKTAAGERYQVDVLARDPEAPGVAHTPAFDLYLCNQGDGSKASDEEHGLGAMALASALEAAVGAGATVPRLSTLRERNRRFPGGVFSVRG